MRKTLPVLALLATLAASSHAVITGTATSTADVSYTLGAGLTASYSNVSVDGRVAGEYIYNYDGDNGTAAPSVYEYLNDNGDTAPVLDPTRYTTASDSGAYGYAPTDGRVQLSATATGSYLAAASDPSDTFLFRRYGSRAFLRVTNGGTADADIVFDLNTEHRIADVTTDISYDADRNLGQYAAAGGSGDVVVSTVDANDDYFDYADNFGSGNAADGKSGHIDTTFPAGRRSFTLGVGQTVEYEVFTSSYVFLEDDHRPAAPVPEPAPLAALGVGALALLRRRRKA